MTSMPSHPLACGDYITWLLVLPLVNFSLFFTFVDTRRFDNNDHIINTNKGKIRGKRYMIPTLNKAVDAYLGIPFAKPPVQHLRFKHPVPMDRWKGVYNATKLPNSCYQTPDDFFGDFAGSAMWNAPTKVSEDCLYLNVWVPRYHKPSNRHKKLAVLVWIFGGGFYSGTTTLSLYDGKILASTNDVIVVSIGYRIGALGFLSLNTASAPGNAGLFDQLMGLDWVQANIRRFGGDPRNVTLFGESAGSFCVSLHLLSPLSRDKFSRALMQSGTANMPWGTLEVGEARRRAVELATDYLGAPKSSSLDEMAAYLRDVPPHRLVGKQWVSRGVMQFPFLPIVDGSFLVETPAMSLKRRSFKKCPILLGSNLNEGSYFLIYELTSLLTLNRTTMDREQLEHSMQTLFYHYPQFPAVVNPFGMDAIGFQYRPSLDADDTVGNLAALDAALGDCHFLCHVNEFARQYSAAGLPVYSYLFTQRYSSNPWPAWMGVMHGDEIVFVFGEPLKPGSKFNSAEKELSRRIMRFWTNFAKTGDPNRSKGRGNLNAWPKHSVSGLEYLELHTKFLRNSDKSLAVSRGPRSKQCSFWTDYLPGLVVSTDILEQRSVEQKQTINETIPCVKDNASSASPTNFPLQIYIYILVIIILNQFVNTS